MVPKASDVFYSSFADEICWGLKLDNKNQRPVVFNFLSNDPPVIIVVMIKPKILVQNLQHYRTLNPYHQIDAIHIFKNIT